MLFRSYDSLMRMSLQMRHTPQEVVAELVAYAMRQIDAQKRGQEPVDPPAGYLGDGVTQRPGW